jgi:kumamolisin
MPLRKGYVRLKGSERSALPGAEKIAPADPHEQIEVTIRLRRGSDPATFPSDAQMGAPLRDRQYLSRDEFAATHGARPDDCARIRAFASQHGLRVVAEDLGRRSVTLSGTVEALTKAFAVDLHRYSLAGRTYRCREGAIEIPAELEDVIEGVFGLDNRPQSKTHFRRKAGPAATDVSYSALQLAQAYNFPAGTDGTGQAIAILELGGGYAAADLDTYFKNLGLATPSVTAISVDKAKNDPTGSADGPDGEVELDIEVVGAIAPGAKIGVYFAPNTDQGFIDAVTTAVNDKSLLPSILSISWGGPESSWTEQARISLNSACQDAATMGVTVLVASGDDGATDGASDGSLSVDFPASSPFVLGCGGTTLAISSGKITSEKVWNDLSQDEGATGGGVSEVFSLPSFQGAASVPAAPNGFAGRGVPDVAADADPSSGFNVVVDGQSTVVGGTSAVAPLWAGLLARINQSLGKPVGYLNPLLYSSAVAQTFRDITSGTNGGFSAGPGWDPCTGLGTPNGAALLSALKNQSTP